MLRYALYLLLTAPSWLALVLFAMLLGVSTTAWLTGQDSSNSGSFG